jgi:hypothetical protein
VRSVIRKYTPTRWIRATLAAATLTGGLCASKPAAAEVTIAKGDTWDAYVAGRAGAFLSYAFGQGYPVPKQPGSTLQNGSGVDPEPTRDTIYEYDAMGAPIKTQQGKLSKMRVRSGYYPNVITVGARKNFGPDLKLTAQLSVWGTVESDDVLTAGDSESTPANGTRDNGVSADFREGFLRLEGRWGQVDGGRYVTFAGRGLTEIDVLYAHGYGVGFPLVRRDITLPLTGDLSFPGPTTGMNGFGVVGATHAPGVSYLSPSLSGLRLGLGIFEAAKYTSAGWSLTSTVRPEGQVTYDIATSSVKAHVFVDGGFQTLKQGGGLESESLWGATFGGRLEVGPVRVGAGGFYGKGIGLSYAFDENESLSSPSTMQALTMPDGSVTMVRSNKIRNQRGFMGVVQLVLGPVDLHGAFGQTVLLLLPEDKAAAATLSVIKSQTGISAGAVYHLNESLHLDVDFMNAGYRWYGGETQAVNVVNAGATVTF